MFGGAGGMPDFSSLGNLLGMGPVDMPDDPESSMKFGPGVDASVHPWQTWKIIYPAYLEKTTLNRGRRVGLNEYALLNVSPDEIEQALEVLGFLYVREPKAHPSFHRLQGRFRIGFVDAETGDPAVEGVTTKLALLKLLSQMIKAQRGEV